MKWKTLAPGKLDELVKSEKSVFVINTSRLPSGDKGAIMVNFFDGNRKEFFKMPPTFIPMAVTDVIPPEKLVNSRDFRETLQMGMLSLVDSDQAQDYLNTEDAREEYENLVLSEMSTKSRGLHVDHSVAKRAQVSHGNNEMHGPRQDLNNVDTISNKVRALVESMNSETISAKECLTQLRRHQSALNRADLSYVVANSSDEKLTKWTNQALNDLISGEDTEFSTADTGSFSNQRTSTEKPVDTSATKVEAAFDFDAKDDEMTPEERRADEEAKAKAAADQALHGESKAADQISDMLKGNL